MFSAYSVLSPAIQPLNTCTGNHQPRKQDQNHGRAQNQLPGRPTSAQAPHHPTPQQPSPSHRTSPPVDSGGLLTLPRHQSPEHWSREKALSGLRTPWATRGAVSSRTSWGAPITHRMEGPGGPASPWPLPVQASSALPQVVLRDRGGPCCTALPFPPHLARCRALPTRQPPGTTQSVRVCDLLLGSPTHPPWANSGAHPLLAPVTMSAHDATVGLSGHLTGSSPSLQTQGLT